MNETYSKEFLSKHKILSDEEIKKIQYDAFLTKDKYAKDTITIESNLLNFHQQLYPMINPYSTEGEVLCWIRQLSLKEMLSETPEKLVEAMRKAESVEEAKELVKSLKIEGAIGQMYELMSKMIAIPEKTADEWADFANPEFTHLFDITVAVIYSRVSDQLSFF